MATITVVTATTVKFGSDADIRSMRELVAVRPKLRQVEFIRCTEFDEDRFCGEVVPAISKTLTSLTLKQVKLGDLGVTALLQRCPSLTELRIIDCHQVTPQLLESLGLHCRLLTTLVITYQSGSPWTVDDILRPFVKHIVSDLISVTLVGFDSVTDIGVSYVAECYYSTLQVVNFSSCAKLTDKAIEGLVLYCKQLRQVGLSGTLVSDSGIVKLATSSQRLTHVDMAACAAITDMSCKALATHCPLLLHVNVENCTNVSDDSLVVLANGCPRIEYLNMTGTSLRTVSPMVLLLRRLKELHLRKCRELKDPPSDVTRKGLTGVKEYYKDYNLSYKFRVYFVGGAGSGKTSVVSTLLHGEPKMADTTTYGVTTQCWLPFTQHGWAHKHGQLLGRRVHLEERHLVLELWDLSGRQVCQALHHLYCSQHALYVVVFNPQHSDVTDTVLSQVTAIQAKTPGCRILLVATRADQGLSDDVIKRHCQGVMLAVLEAEERAVRSIKTEISNIRQMEPCKAITGRMKALHQQLRQRPLVIKQVCLLSCKTGQGIDELKRLLFTNVLDYEMYPWLGEPLLPVTLRLYHVIHNLRMRGDIVLTWTGFRAAISSYGLTLTEMELIQHTDIIRKAGGIIVLHVPSVSRPGSPVSQYIVLHPATYANAVCSLHLDHHCRPFRVEAARFWPSEGEHVRPTPGLLVSALEDIPNKGLLKESLLPLLWQDLYLEEPQLMLLLSLLQSLLIVLPSDRPPTAGPVNGNGHRFLMPLYPGLSADRTYHLVTMWNLPDKKPQLNWTARPFHGDIQCNWQYRIASTAPAGMFPCLLAACYTSCKPLASYIHVWRDGILLRLKEAMVRVEYGEHTLRVKGLAQAKIIKKSAMICVEYGEHTLRVSCRVNADEGEAEMLAVQYMWGVLGLVLYPIHTRLQDWPALLYMIEIEVFGQVLFEGETMADDHIFHLYELLDVSQQDGVFAFMDKSEVRELDVQLLMPNNAGDFDELDSWIDHLHQTGLKLLHVNDSTGTNHMKNSPGELEKTTSNKKETKKKKKDIKWRLDEIENEEVKKAKLRRYSSERITNQPCDSGEPGDARVERVTSADSNRGHRQISSSTGPTSQGDTDDRITTNGQSNNVFGFSEEEYMRQATRVSSSFVSAILANAMAEYIKYQQQDNHSLQKIYPIQVDVARAAADASMATHCGRVEGAAEAVVAAAKRVQMTHDRQHGTGDIMQSRMCTVL